MTDTTFKTEDRQQVEKITALIKTMDESEKDKMLIFMQGVKFAENLHTEANK